MNWLAGVLNHQQNHPLQYRSLPTKMSREPLTTGIHHLRGPQKPGISIGLFHSTYRGEITTFTHLEGHL